jgi:hypothetical protein
MPLNVLLLPLLGGFIFVTFWNRTKWYAVRAERERLVIYASIAGYFHLVIAWLLTLIIPIIVRAVPRLADPWDAWIRWWMDHRPFEYAGTGFIAFTLACVSWKFFNWCWTTRDKEAGRILVQEGGPLEQILDLAMDTGKRVMITLKGGKVYIGRVDSSFIPGQLSRTIHILPTKSGYREPEKKWVTITTDYLEVYEAIRQRYPDEFEEIIADFGVVVPIDDIASLSLFRDRVHAEFFPPRHQPSASPPPMLVVGGKINDPHLPLLVETLVDDKLKLPK